MYTSSFIKVFWNGSYSNGNWLFYTISHQGVIFTLLLKHFLQIWLLVLTLYMISLIFSNLLFRLSLSRTVNLVSTTTTLPPTHPLKCLSVSLSVSLSVFSVFFSRRLIGWYTGFGQWFWQPTYPTRCSELGWAVPHSDFLAWLSSATLKNFISGVSSRILMR